MYLENLTNRGTTPTLINTLAFTEARLRTIADNIANVHTPGHTAKHLDVGSFQAALRKAIDTKGSDPNKPFVVESRQAASAADGTLRVTPSEKPVRNVLFHDGTNLSIEREMAELAETGMTHELATTLLGGNFDGLRKAIRGQV